MPKLIGEDSIIIEKAIIHFLDLNGTEAVLSDKTTVIDDDTEEYLKAHIVKLYNSDDVKKCEFERDGYVKSHLGDIGPQFVEISQEIAKRFFGVMQDAGSIPSGDLIELICNIGGEEYYGVFKLNYKTSYIHEFRNIADRSTINFVKHHGVLPGIKHKVDEAFLINIDTKEILLLEKKYEINGVKDFYISSGILGATDSLSVKGQVELVKKAEEKLYREHFGETVDMKPRVAETIFKELNAQDEFKISHIIDNFDEAFPEAGPELRSMLEHAPIEKDKQQPVPETFYKRIARQKITSEAGIEIKIPTKVYRNKNAMEFIYNDDGSVSLVIKNIINGKEEDKDELQ